MPRLLKPPQEHERQQTAHVQAVAGGIEPAVHRPLPRAEPFGKELGSRRLIDEAPPGEVGEDGHRKGGSWKAEGRSKGEDAIVTFVFTIRQGRVPISRCPLAERQCR